MDYVLPLAEIGMADVPRVGMKAAVLGDLRGAGFLVPDGFAVTTDALRDALDEAGPDTAITELPVSAKLAEQVSAALERLGDSPVAVRSSGVSEDLAGRSFAGMYESYLNVSGVAAALEAIRNCWASGFSERITAYHEELADSPAQVAVLVQRMVPARTAGVAFSVNPVTGQRDEVSLSAVSGLGDKLMSGESVADEWTVRDGAATRISGDGAAIDATDVLRVAELVSGVAAHAGGPQDMEWAIADGALHVLQARPITGLSSAEQIPMTDEVPDGFWAQAPNAHAPWVPMQRSVFVPILDASIHNVFRYITGADVDARTIHGRAYLHTLPDSADEQVRKLEEIGAAVAAGEQYVMVRRWHDEWKPDFAATIRALRHTDLRALDDAGFARHFGELVALFTELHEVYFILAGAGIAVMGELGLACTGLDGFAPAEVFELIGGQEGDHTPATARLGDLARLAAADPELRAGLANGTIDAAALSESGLSEQDGAFGAAFAAYLDEYGHRTIGFDITEPTLAEYPDTVLNLVTAQLDAPYEATARRAALTEARQAALATAERALRGADEDTRQRFERAVAGAVEGAPLRDEKVFYAVSAWAVFRYATQELGRRLHAAGLVDDRDDAFYLALDEALGALREHTDVRASVRIGRGQHNWALANPGPRAYGEFALPAAIDEAELSPAARHVRTMSGWSMSLQGGPSATADGDQLAGLPASAGRYTGTVRVIGGIEEFDKLRKGDVLVCKETTSQWSVLFVLVGALVTDQGSLLSHPAIIAREYGVPAVVATGTATGVLHDGQLVTVDGSAGTVTPANT